MVRRLILCVPLLFCVAAAQKRPFTFEDMMSIKRVGDPALSPDGRWVLFTAVEVNLQENTRTPHIWVVPLLVDPGSGTAGGARQLTSDPAGEERARWSPDGKHFLFVSSRNGRSQIWIVDFNEQAGAISGGPHPLTSISTEAKGALWSPDGKNIVFVSEVYPECNGAPNEDACNKGKDEERDTSKVKALVFTRLLFRHWDHYASGKRSHLFVVPAEGGTPRDLTPGDHDVPPFSLGGQDDYAISPDGQEVCYTSNHDEVEAISTNNDLFIVPISGGRPKRITTNPGSDSTPLYSPDGKYIAYRAQLRAGYESDRYRLMLYERATGKITNLTKNFNRWVESYAWAPNSHNIYLVCEIEGERPIYVRKIGDEITPYQIVPGFNNDLGITPNGGTILFTRRSVQSPPELYAANLQGIEQCTGAGSHACDTKQATERQITHLNDTLLSQIDMQPLEPFWFTGAEDAKVEGFILKPPQFDASKKYPVKFLIHGGPHYAFRDSWLYWFNPELFAANGYVVVMINPRGSSGYGRKFADEMVGDWGGRDFHDLMLGLDYVERTYSFVDKDRECALGVSVGGYLVNWIAGHTRRFRCLVSSDGMFNLSSAYASTEELWFFEWEFKGTPWSNPELYRKWSPNLAAANFHTPTLIVHGQLDYRLDVAEGLQFFTVLQRLKVPSKMLYFPDEGHLVEKPQNSQLWYSTVNEWVDQWVGKK